MSYQVLARKWRPRSFDTMAGQEHVLRAIKNALEQNRLHHAYLFTGTRGVGKTTVARIIAKALNCETGITANPCGKCDACVAIDAGRFVDLIEVDAASRTKVEDTRELLDNVQYAPTQGRYKIYLIDEVHMLSGHSFNALLKTLEEPPEHVKFLLATTDPQKLPITVLSRCLQFHLKNLSPERIEQHLTHILGEEKVAFEPAALMQIARAANGSMRDALSLTDQAIAYCEGDIKSKAVSAMLGNIEQDAVTPLIDGLAEANVDKLLTHIHALTELGVDFESVLNELASTLHYIAIAQMAPEAINRFQAHAESIQAYAKQFSAEDIQLYYQIALIGKRDLNLAPDPRSGFEMVMLRMLAFQPNQTSTPAKARPAVSTKPQPAPVKTQAAAPQAKTTESKPSTPVKQAATNNWEEIIAAAELTGMTQLLASNCTLISLDDNKMDLRLSPDFSAMLNERSQARLTDSLSQYFGKTMKINIETGETSVETPAEKSARQANEKQQAAYDNLSADPAVRELMDTFDTSLNPNAVSTAKD